MYSISNISDDANQLINIVLEDGSRAPLTLTFDDNSKCWTMSINYGPMATTNRRVFTNPNMLRQWKNLIPFGLSCWTLDESEPFLVDDFSNGRCGIDVLNATEVQNYENYLISIKP